jgi:Putative phage tail protein
MATIAFTVIGSAIGGPVGGLIGSVIGQQIDNVIFRPKAREGPRIKELAVQTSSYGTQIPAVFGAMRVAGSVIWATDLIETRNRSSGGKGRPATVSYSYSVSLAVALSSRPIARVGRIWAEGNLLRGSQGDFKVETGFRFHSGHDDQAPDPLIASAEGAGNCPAYRRTSYAVFENLQLADFGNRIPSMTFELFERDGSVLIAEIISAASSGGIVNAGSSESVSGYALQGQNARSALAPLFEAGGSDVRPAGDRLELFWPDAEGAYAGDISPVVQSGSESLKPQTDRRAALRQQPVAVTLRYYDPQRDYQAGLQRSGWAVNGAVDNQIDLPAVLGTAQASTMARNIGLRLAAARDRLQVAVGLSRNALMLGQSVGAGSMRAKSMEHFTGFSIVDCERWPMLPAAWPSPTEPGRHQPAPDLSSGATLLHVLELPSLGASAATEPIVAVAAAGTGAGWRRAAVSRNVDGGQVSLGIVSAPSAIGELIASLSAHSPNLLDTNNVIRIRMLSSALPPELVAASPLSADAPALMLGDELIRYGAIEPLGNDLFAVSHLQRDVGKSGSVSHPVGERVVFVERDRLLLPDLGGVAAGASFEIEAIGLGDPLPVIRTAAVAGLAIRPLAPAHGRAEKQPDGGLALRWIRRARHDPGWLDGVDLPIVEAANRFLLTIARNGAQLSSIEVSGESVTITASEIQSWAVASGGTIECSVRQIGDFGLSDALVLQVAL